MSKRSHVFISHHYADDAHVTRLTNMLKRNGYDIRNSSIRAKPANRERLKNGLIKDAVLKRLLRMKMSWASTVVVLVGARTHTRPWVDWEIRKAHELGKRIVSIYTRGGTEADVPAALEDYGSALVNWNSGSLMDAITGQDSPFEKPGGEERAPVHGPATSRCGA
ncbi:MAG: TIR domain-containing protein [Methylobacterium frigidaeris]